MIKKFVKLYDIGNFMEFLKGVYHFYFLKLWNNLKTKFSIWGLFKIFWLTVRYYKKKFQVICISWPLQIWIWETPDSWLVNAGEKQPIRSLEKKEKNYSASRHPFTKVNDKMSAIKSFKLVMSREIGLRYPKLGFHVFWKYNKDFLNFSPQNYVLTAKDLDFQSIFRINFKYITENPIKSLILAGFF